MQPSHPPLRRALLPALVEFICKYWHHPRIVENLRLDQKP